MSDPSKSKDATHEVPTVGSGAPGVRANRPQGETGKLWPPKPGAEGSAPVRQPFAAGTEGLCQTMPELGTIPFPRERVRGRRVVRLVSATPGTELSIELQAGVNRIGRQRTDNHIVLVSPQVSRFHSEIDVHDDLILVKDLGSANGTFVNGVRVTEQVVHAGDLIGFSDQFTLRLLIDMALEEPDSVTLAAQAPAEDPMPLARPMASPGLLGRDAVPASLEKRRSQLDALPVAEPPPPAPPPRAPIPRPVAPPAPSPLDLLPQTEPTPPTMDADEGDLLQGLGGGGAEGGEVSVLERERRQLAVLYQVSKRCMTAESLAELDRLLINVLERVVSFDRGFITYQLPSGDWKLVMSPKGDRWERRVVRDLLQTALKSKGTLVVADARTDTRLGRSEHRAEERMLLPLRSRGTPMGAVFLISTKPGSFTAQAADFLSLFADIAALAVVNCARLEAGRS